MNSVQSFFFNNLWRFSAFFLLTAVGCTQNLAVVSGKVVRVSGNQMPSPDLPPLEPRGWQTKVYLFDPLTSLDLKSAGSNGVYLIGATSPVKVIKTDAEGRFRAKVKSGMYSVLIARDSLTMFTNIKDGNGLLNPVRLEKGKKNTIRLEASWDAVH